ncbi:hypothetical protein ACOALA_17090 [Alicyclobacillus acidoterrestris]|uniref:hypothetical protein n=1 Tax=Alicyclobacillus acidoterrestris TaxID=1450 RepID=UPI003F52B39E
MSMRTLTRGERYVESLDGWPHSMAERRANCKGGGASCLSRNADDNSAAVRPFG